MQNFIAIYLGTDAANAEWSKMDVATQNKKEEEGMAAWAQWMADHEDKIVDQGGPIGKTKKVNKDGVTDVKNQIAAYVIVKAESHEEAAKMFLNHPHFMSFPGDSIEIMPVLDMPKM